MWHTKDQKPAFDSSIFVVHWEEVGYVACITAEAYYFDNFDVICWCYASDFLKILPVVFADIIAGKGKA